MRVLDIVVSIKYSCAALYKILKIVRTRTNGQAQRFPVQNPYAAGKAIKPKITWIPPSNIVMIETLSAARINEPLPTERQQQPIEELQEVSHYLGGGS